MHSVYTHKIWNTQIWRYAQVLYEIIFLNSQACHSCKPINSANARQLKHFYRHIQYSLVCGKPLDKLWGRATSCGKKRRARSQFIISAQSTGNKIVRQCVSSFFFFQRTCSRILRAGNDVCCFLAVINKCRYTMISLHFRATKLLRENNWFYYS